MIGRSLGSRAIYVATFATYLIPAADGVCWKALLGGNCDNNDDDNEGTSGSNIMDAISSLASSSSSDEENDDDHCTSLQFGAVNRGELTFGSCGVEGGEGKDQCIDFEFENDAYCWAQDTLDCIIPVTAQVDNVTVTQEPSADAGAPCQSEVQSSSEKLCINDYIKIRLDPRCTYTFVVETSQDGTVNPSVEQTVNGAFVQNANGTYVVDESSSGFYFDIEGGGGREQFYRIKVDMEKDNDGDVYIELDEDED